MLRVLKTLFLDANVVRNNGEDNIIIALAPYDDPEKIFNIQISMDDTDKLSSELRDCIVTHETM